MCHPCREDAFLDACFDRVRKLAKHCRSMRACGSCALNLCSVACGRCDVARRGAGSNVEEQLS